eukprot:CAMPEP_0195060690 /NCGR_PEP_ID=MMETSP0448-20130528/7883_1 /TAXON_ID=66468 /ORGANISM="Heterocapsa triquestra, Strain CCMP 448" /LENGTH=45 /DNA_ID= /DNA_START= /DNA_END= /DNA_ORIENTATION=
MLPAHAPRMRAATVRPAHPHNEGLGSALSIRKRAAHAGYAHEEQS